MTNNPRNFTTSELVRFLHSLADSGSIGSYQLAAAAKALEEAKRMAKWAIPLAQIAMEDYRMLRLTSGHSDIGTKRVGLYDDEWEKCEAARDWLARHAQPEGGDDAPQRYHYSGDIREIPDDHE